MNPLALILSFFAVVFAGVAACGYLLTHNKEDALPALRTLSRRLLLRAGGAVPAGPAGLPALERKLRFAGYRQPSAPRLLAGIKVAVALVLGLITFAVKVADGDGLFALFGSAAVAGIGYLAPDFLLDWLIRRRSLRLLGGIPPAIDLMVLSLEAGQSLDSTMTETARELRQVYPDLSGELNIAGTALAAGQSRTGVWTELKERNRQPELNRLVQVLLESGRFGTSLAPALRIHARYLRTRLRQEAYGEARKLGVKLIFPIFFLIFPSIILVTLGPALLRIFSQMGRMGQ